MDALEAEATATRRGPNSNTASISNASGKAAAALAAGHGLRTTTVVCHDISTCFRFECGMCLTGWLRVFDREGSDSGRGDRKVARLGACSESEEESGASEMIHTGKSRHGNDEKRLQLHLGVGGVGGFGFQSQMRVGQAPSSVLEFLGLFASGSWKVAWGLPLLYTCGSLERQAARPCLLMVNRG